MGQSPRPDRMGAATWHCSLGSDNGDLEQLLSLYPISHGALLW